MNNHHDSRKRVSLGRVIFLSGLTLPVLNGAYAQQQQRSPGHDLPYATVLNESTLVVVGAIRAAEFVQIKDQQGPPPQPRSGVDSCGTPITIMPQSASWFLSELFDPPHIEAYRIDLQVLEAVQGQAANLEIIKVNLVYGIHKVPVESLWDAYRKTVRNDNIGSEITLHLRPVQGNLGIYELVSKPWIVRVGGEFQARQDMKLRMRRYAAYQEIENLVGRFEQLAGNDLSRLHKLVSSEIPELGQVTFMAREVQDLEGLKTSAAPVAERAQAWRTWWASKKHGYIQQSLRIMAAGNAGEDAGSR